MRISKIRLQELINEVVEETTNQGRILQEQNLDFTFLISSLEGVLAALEEAKDDAADAPDISRYIEDTWNDFNGHLEDIRTRASAAAEAEETTPKTAVALTTEPALEESEYLEEMHPAGVTYPKRDDKKKKKKKKTKKKSKKKKKKVLYGEGDELEEEIELNEEELEEMILDEFDALRE